MNTIEKQMSLFKKKLIKMSLDSYQAMADSYTVILNQDRNLAHQIIKHDDNINHQELDINNLAIEILSLLHPVAKDLRYLLAGLKIATDLERIADYAKSIARNVVHEEIPIIYLKHLLLYHQFMLENLHKICTLIQNPNVEKAYIYAQEDAKLDVIFLHFKNIVSQEMNRMNHMPFSVFDIARVIERAGDHSKNICEQVIYLLEGKILDFN